MTRAQEDTVEALALEHGRVAVREGFTHQLIHATVPTGECRWIRQDGSVAKVEHNFSINWRQ